MDVITHNSIQVYTLIVNYVDVDVDVDVDIYYQYYRWYQYCIMMLRHVNNFLESDTDFVSIWTSSAYYRW